MQVYLMIVSISFSDVRQLLFTSLMIHLYALDSLEHHIKILVDPGAFFHKNLNGLLLFHRNVRRSAHWIESTFDNRFRNCNIQYAFAISKSIISNFGYTIWDDNID